MNANLPPVLRNAVDGLPCEIARKCFLWLAEHHDSTAMKYRAEELAHECSALIAAVRTPLTLAGGQHGATEDCMNDLMRFILKRWVVWRLGPNTRAWWELGS